MKSAGIVVKICLAIVLSSLFLNGCVISPKPTGDMDRDEIIEEYLANRQLDPIEGVWRMLDDKNEITIVKNTFDIHPDYEYIGIVTKSDYFKWPEGTAKMLLHKTAEEMVFLGSFYYGITEYGATFILDYETNQNLLEIIVQDHPRRPTHFALIRIYPSSDEQSANGSGSGFFIAPEIIVTNDHVIDKAKNITVYLNDGSSVEASVAVRDKGNDLAILKINDDSPRPASLAQIQPLPLGAVQNSTEGDRIYVIGFPLPNTLGSNIRISEGIINSTVGFENDPRYFQMSAETHPGNSGGPLLNEHGEVIGVVTQVMTSSQLLHYTGTTAQNVNFSVKINYLSNLLQQIPGTVTPKIATEKTIKSAKELMQDARAAVVRVVVK